MKEALSLWEERERARAEILAAVDEAEASLARGEGRIITQESMHELAEEARGTYGPDDKVHDGVHLRFVNELCHRLTRVIEQLLAEEATRPADDVVLRMLLAPRADKVAERLVFNAYGRAIQGFESYDTTVLMGS